MEPSAVAGLAFQADLAEVASSDDLAGDVTVGMTSSAIAEVASSANIAEVASSADLAGNVTVGVMSLADPVSVVTAGVAFREECGERDVVPSDSVCDYGDYFYDAQYDDDRSD